MKTRLSSALAAALLGLAAASHAEDAIRFGGESHRTPAGMVFESGAYRDGSEGGACARESLYRKKIAILGFPLEQPRDTTDLRRVSDGLAILFDKRLRAAFDTHTFPRSKVTFELPQNELHALWINRSIQFSVYAGMEDMAVLYAGQRSRFQNPLGQNYSSGKRGLVATLYIHDNLTGKVIAAFPYAATIDDSDYNNQPLSILSREFLESAYGQALQAMLDEFALRLEETLRCLPFMVQIIDVRGDQIILDAGRLHGLKAGDQLVVYHQHDTVLKPEAPEGEVRLERPIATLTLTEVQPNVAVGILEPNSANGQLSKGDIARAQ